MGSLPSAKFFGPSLYEKGFDTDISVTFEQDGAQLAFTVAANSYSLFKPGVTDAFLTKTISVSGGVGTITILAADLADEVVSDRWREVWEVTITSTSRVIRARTNSSLVKFLYFPAFAQSDLEAISSDIRDPDLRPDDVTSYQPQIDQARHMIDARLINAGRRPWLIVDPWKLRLPHMYLTCALIFEDWITRIEANDRWEQAAERNRELYELEWSRLTFEYDLDEDGDADVSESAASTVFMGPMADRGW